MTALRDDYVAALERENDELRERIVALEEIIGMRLEAPLVLELTPAQARMFGMLMARDFCTKQALMSGLYGLRHDGEVAEEKIIDVWVCKMRPKLKPWGMTIETKWGEGYWMPAESKAIAAKLMQAPTEIHRSETKEAVPA